jgi:hypothetical protein
MDLEKSIFIAKEGESPVKAQYLLFIPFHRVELFGSIALIKFSGW